MILYVTKIAINTDVITGSLGLTYLKGNLSSSFTFLISLNPFGQKRDIINISDIYSIDIKVNSIVNPTLLVGFYRLVGGTCKINQ